MGWRVAAGIGAQAVWYINGGSCEALVSDGATGRHCFNFTARARLSITAQCLSPPSGLCWLMIAILLATYNGARFLPEQLASFEHQTEADWHLFWRDDGSTDNTVAIMEEFSARTRNCTRIMDPIDRLGATNSFLLLLQEAAKTLGEMDIVAFSDQDDVWFPEKLKRAKKTLVRTELDVPAIYFARQRLIDENNNAIGESKPIHFLPSFPRCLAQNVAAGCTIALNRRAVSLINQTKKPKIEFHDWWCYIIVLACGGLCLYDKNIVINYRQHSNNTIGAQRNYIVRALGAMRRGPYRFMEIFRAHIDALSENMCVLEHNAKNAVSLIKNCSKKHRLIYILIKYGVARETIPETVVFYMWVIFG